MAWLVVVAVIVGVLTLFSYVMKLRRGRCTSQADLTGRVVIVTGASRGIGYQVALDLASRNAKVILANRPGSDAEKAVTTIREDTGNLRVVHKSLDLSSLKSIRKFAEEINRQETRLDILINNAGICGHSFRRTEEGLEFNMATNHFGPFLLTNLLLDLLKKSAPSRILVTSSIVHHMGNIDLGNLNAEKSFNRLTIYNDTKLANLLFAHELNKKLENTGVTVNSLHPGSVQTNLLDYHWGPIPYFMDPIQKLFFRTTEEGAQTTIHLAISQDVEGISGKYFSDCREDSTSKKGKDDGMAKNLWEISEQLTGLA